MPEVDIDERAEVELQRLLASSDNSTRQMLIELTGRPGTRLLAAEADSLLFRIQSLVRDEYPKYKLFLAGQLVEVRRCHMFSEQYCFANLPTELQGKRHWVEERFSALILATTDSLGWWDQLGAAQQQMCKPKFMPDGFYGHSFEM